MTLKNVSECDKIMASQDGRVRCPYCGKPLPGRYPNGVAGALLICKNSKCRSGGREIEVNIPAAQRIQHPSAH